MAVRQRHGVGGIRSTNQKYCDGGGEAITVTDGDDDVRLSVTTHQMLLDCAEARYLSQRLAEAADRVEAKMTDQTTTV